jgi:hypothetical protein
VPPKDRRRADEPKRRKKRRAGQGHAEELALPPLAPAPPPPAPEERGLPVRRILRGIEGARLCYGEPLNVEGRTVITVARVRAAGAGLTDASAGGVDAAPLGFIEVTAGEARFHAIDDPERGLRALRAATGAATTLLGALAGARALARRRRVAALLPRPRR